MRKFVSIRMKIYAVTFLMIILGALFCSVGTFAVMQKSVVDKARSDYKLIANNLASAVNDNMTEIARYSELLSTDSNAIRYLQEVDGTDMGYELFLWQAQIAERVDFIRAMGSRLIKQLYICDRQGEALLYRDRETYGQFFSSELREHLDESGFFECGGELYHISQMIGPDSLEKIGKVIIKIDEENFLSPLERVAEEHFYAALQTGETGTVWKNAEDGPDYELIDSIPLQQDGWRVITKIDRSVLMHDLLPIGCSVAVILVLVLLVSYFVIQLTLDYIIRPLLQLTDEIRQFDLDDTRQMARIASNDEVGVIAAEYRRLVERIRNLVVKLKKQKQKEVDLYMAQINPHFIYNTLFALICVAEQDGRSDIAEKIKDVSNILCFSLYHQIDSYHTIEQEMVYIDKYLGILKYKYGKGIVFRWDVPEELRSERIGVLLLYPLVENAVFHGLAGRQEKRLCVRMRPEGTEIRITVEDNGCGMSAEEIFGIQSRLEQTMREVRGEDTEVNIDKTHMGLQNLRLRLWFLYGEPARIGIESGKERGTRVTINIGRT